jgi:deoxyadenosine/deoxycytidine kinase
VLVLAIAGMVGAGKTTLTRALAARFGLQVALESVDADNPWLDRYYGGPDAMRMYAMNLQLHFLATRFKSVRRMRSIGGAWILDRTWYEDAEIFARGLYEQGIMSADEWTLYQRLYT